MEQEKDLDLQEKVLNSRSDVFKKSAHISPPTLMSVWCFLFCVSPFYSRDWKRRIESGELSAFGILKKVDRSSLREITSSN
jgi:hypothetical protein